MAAKRPAPARSPWGPCRALSLGARIPVLAGFLALCLTTPVPAGAAGGGGGGGGGGGSLGGSARTSPSAARSPNSPEAAAQDHYERGLRHREDALKLEKKAAKSDKGFLFFAPPSKQAAKEWKRAVEEFEKATQSKDDYYQAYNELGHAYRKLGHYEKALVAYDRALDIRPTYGRAIEYRGEAYLKLGRLEDAKTSYGRLAVLDRELAGQLMATMQEWLTQNGDEPVEGVSAEELDAFRAWVEEQSQLAARRNGGRSPVSSGW